MVVPIIAFLFFWGLYLSFRHKLSNKRLPSHCKNMTLCKLTLKRVAAYPV